MLIPDYELTDWIKSGLLYNYVFDKTKVSDLSCGVTPYGYDIRLAPQVKFLKASQVTLDPKLKFNNELNQELFDDLEVYNSKLGDFVLLSPFSFALGLSLESVNLPNNVMALVTTKSTYARLGLNLNCTSLQAGFKGNIVLELFNQTDNYLKVYVNEAISNLIFFRCDQESKGYAGKYQDQNTIVKAKGG